MNLNDPSHLYIRGRLRILEERVRAAVARRRAEDADPDDRFRGLYISDAQIDGLLAGSQAGLEPAGDHLEEARQRLDRDAEAAEARGAVVRLRRLARSFGLTDVDVELLLIALAPDLDARFERFYGYLHDDVTRRRASTGLALELCDPGFGTVSLRARLFPEAPLLRRGLLLVEDADRPYLTRSLRVPDRVAAHVLGHDQPDHAIEPLLSEPIRANLDGLDRVTGALEAGLSLFYLRERIGSAGASLAASALSTLGYEAIVVDLTRLAPGDDPLLTARLACREAGLRAGGLVVGPIDSLVERDAVLVRGFVEHDGPVFLLGARGWDPSWSRRIPLVLDAPMASVSQRNAMWDSALQEIDAAVPGDLDPESSMPHFRLTPEQVARAASVAAQQAIAEGRRVGSADLQSGARAQNSAGLERLARRIEPRVSWDDLVLPPVVVAQLKELTARVRHRDHVLDRWGMGRRSSKGRGITALFAGDSGTGKTMSAEIISGDLGMDLYVIDLSTVVDKYIGETEKNLDRIFGEADRVNGVLLFDEADAIFGKRSEVKDAHDRYANIEVAYLLQRMEVFDGLAILTTNLRSNVDDAFTRRLDSIVDFPMPEEDDRRLLWAKNLREELPKGDDIDLDFLARSFKLAGGNIRNIAVTAAYLAAAQGGRVSMKEMIRATETEYRKLGRLCVAAEFGSYFHLLEGSSRNGDSNGSISVGKPPDVILGGPSRG